MHSQNSQYIQLSTSLLVLPFFYADDLHEFIGNADIFNYCWMKEVKGSMKGDSFTPRQISWGTFCRHAAQYTYLIHLLRVAHRVTQVTSHHAIILLFWCDATVCGFYLAARSNNVTNFHWPFMCLRTVWPEFQRKHTSYQSNLSLSSLILWELWLESMASYILSQLLGVIWWFPLTSNALFSALAVFFHVNVNAPISLVT